MRRRLPTNANGALAEMLARDQEAGIDVFDDGPTPRPAIAPPLRVEPLLPVVIPPVNWREEEEAIARAERAAQNPEPEELAPPPPSSLQATPAKRRQR